MLIFHKAQKLVILYFQHSSFGDFEINAYIKSSLVISSYPFFTPRKDLTGSPHTTLIMSVLLQYYICGSRKLIEVQSLFGARVRGRSDSIFFLTVCFVSSKDLLFSPVEISDLTLCIHFA